MQSMQSHAVGGAVAEFGSATALFVYDYEILRVLQSMQSRIRAVPYTQTILYPSLYFLLLVWEKIDCIDCKTR